MAVKEVGIEPGQLRIPLGRGRGVGVHTDNMYLPSLPRPVRQEAVYLYGARGEHRRHAVCNGEYPVHSLGKPLQDHGKERNLKLPVHYMESV